MEFTIKKLISIDEEVEKFKKDKEEELKNMKIELNEFLVSLEEKEEKEILQIKKEIIDYKIREAEIVADSIKKQKAVELESISQKYKTCKEEIETKLVKEILNSK